MQATEGHIGRVFVLRLEDGDEVGSCIENFAREHGIQLGYVNFIGGISSGEIGTGAKSAQARPVDLNLRQVEGVHDTAAMGLIAPDENNQPSLRLCGALGRESQTIAGSLRAGLKTWLGAEAILYEILGADCRRVSDAKTGLAQLQTLDMEREAVVRVQQTRETVVVKKADETYASVLHLFNAWVN